ncbi:MAG: tetraacyldisaccharide 4'-kinase [Planctomycetes bacterium]|nr:tetraacyldisaccharide 4'-kinase [Planctomycetota bacterium]
MRREPTPKLLPLPVPFLAGAEFLYRAGVRAAAALAARRFRAGVWPKHLPRPVLSVGNIVAGGAGKTPLVEAIAREWLRRGGRPAILSRGYRRGDYGNDELLMLARRLPGVPHEQNPDRHRGGLRLLERHPEIDLFILDDGFQHRALFRDLDLVVLDATRPFDFGHCLPRGLLREPWQALARAGFFVITRSEGVSKHKLAILGAFLRERFPKTPISSARAILEGVRTPDGASAPLDPAKSYVAFAGIGNPEAFFATLRRAEIVPVATRVFPDHFAYGAHDLTEIRRWALRAGAGAILCTEKDGVKLESLPGFRDGAPSIYQLRMTYHLPSPHPLQLIFAR